VRAEAAAVAEAAASALCASAAAAAAAHAATALPMTAPAAACAADADKTGAVAVIVDRQKSGAFAERQMPRLGEAVLYYSLIAMLCENLFSDSFFFLSCSQRVE